MISSIIVALVASLLGFCAVGAAGREVEVFMRAQWGDTNLLSEACEVIAAADVALGTSTAFARCLAQATSSVAGLPRAGGSSTRGLALNQGQQHRIASELIRALSPSNGSTSLLLLELNVRGKSPIITAQAHMFSELDRFPADCPPPALRDGTGLHCGKAAISAHIRQTEMEGVQPLPKGDPSVRAAAIESDDGASGHLITLADLPAGLFHSSAGTVARGASGERSVSAILYGVVGQQESFEVLTDLSSRCPQWTVVMRHHPASITQTPLAVQGYGVTLDVKNTEYKTLNIIATGDRDDAAANHSIALPKPTGQVQGIDVDFLMQQFASFYEEGSAGPVLSHTIQWLSRLALNNPSTAEFYHHTNSTPESERTEFKQPFYKTYALGGQLAHWIFFSDDSAKSKDGQRQPLPAEQSLQRLLSLVQEYPVMVPVVQRQVPRSSMIDQRIQQAIETLRGWMPSNYMLLALNNRVVPMSTVALTGVLHRMEVQEKYLLQLASSLRVRMAGNDTEGAQYLPLNPGRVGRLVDALQGCHGSEGNSAEGSHSERRYAFSTDHVHWVNNVEKDPIYQRMGASLGELLKTDMYYRPLFPRRNLFHGIFVLDPGHENAADALRTAIMPLQRGLGVRSGVVFADTRYLRGAHDLVAQLVEDAASHHSHAGEEQKVPIEFRGKRLPDGILEQPTTAVIAALCWAVAFAPIFEDAAKGHHMMRFLGNLPDLLPGLTAGPLEDTLAGLIRLLGEAHLFPLVDGESIMKLLRSAGLPSISQELSLHEFMRSSFFAHYYYQQHTYLNDLGLKKLPLLLFNGQLIYDIERGYWMALNAEMGLIKQWVRNSNSGEKKPAMNDEIIKKYQEARQKQAKLEGKPYDATQRHETIYHWIMEQMKAISRYQSLLYDAPVSVSISDGQLLTHRLEYSAAGDGTRAAGSTRATFLFSPHYNLDAIHVTSTLLLDPNALIPGGARYSAEMKILISLVTYLRNCIQGDAACTHSAATILFDYSNSNSANDDPQNQHSRSVAAVLGHLLEVMADMREERRVRILADVILGAADKGDKVYDFATIPPSVAVPELLERIKAVGRRHSAAAVTALAKSYAGGKVPNRPRHAAFPALRSILTASIGAAAASAAGSPTLPPVFLANGRVILVDHSFIADDFGDLFRQELPEGRRVAACLETGDVMDLYLRNDDKAAVGDEPDTRGSPLPTLPVDDVDTFFIAERIAAASSIIRTTMGRLSAEDDASEGSQNNYALGGWSDQELAARLSASLGALGKADKTKYFDIPELLTIRVGESSSPYAVPPRQRLLAIIDPTTRDAQKVVSLMAALARAMPDGSLAITIILNPPDNVDDNMNTGMSTALYRYVLDPTLIFDSAGAVRPPMARFSGLLGDLVWTLGVDEPEAWMVFPDVAEEDLDNIHMESLNRAVIEASRKGGSNFSASVRVEYGLHGVLVTGKCVDVVTRISPKSLPLTLQSPAVPPLSTAGVVDDTLVMSNYGYFQLRAPRPGLWRVNLQPGEHDERIAVKDAISTPANVYRRAITTARDAERATDIVFVTSWDGSFIHLQVSTTVGEQHAALRRTRRDSSSNELPGLAMEQDRNTNTNASSPPATLNIFSVASGHMYERLLRLMIYTVVKASTSPDDKTKVVKFWLIENFLSPRFKQLLPNYAEKLGFQYQLISYRWPHWLRRQQQKQRTIWAYKILFLDVIFPLGLKKVIFVDADQIVRSDMHELYHLDLDGAPMAYTPFCRQHPNLNTTGFRFWDTGFWVNHLQGRPYHISALYVIDLVQLRRMYGGDTYRMVYDSLSADPHSLANLDQDLPNYVQLQVPIFSLPEHWLWCETWCDAKEKSKAKTIDLCNNPQTKRSKLETARAIVPDWDDMDHIVRDMVGDTDE